MNKFFGLAILVVGIILLAFGISASESVGSEFSRLFTGKPTDKAIWLLLSGVVCTIIGAGGLLIPRSHA